MDEVDSVQNSSTSFMLQKELPTINHKIMPFIKRLIFIFAPSFFIFPLALSLYIILALKLYNGFSNCLPILPWGFDYIHESTQYPCGVNSHILEWIVNNYQLIGLIISYFVTSLIFFVLRQFCHVKRIGRIILKICVIFLWIGLFLFSLYTTTTTGPSLEPSIYSGIYSIYSLFETLSFILLYVLFLSFLFQVIHLKKSIKSILFVFIFFIFLLPYLYMEIFLVPLLIGQSSDIVQQIINIAQQTIYPQTNLQRQVKLSNFKENPLIDSVSGKYKGITLSFYLTVQTKGKYDLNVAISKVPLDDNQTLFTHSGLLTGEKESFDLYPNQPKHITFTMVPSFYFSSLKVNGPYYPTIEVNLTIPTLSESIPNIASVTFIHTANLNTQNFIYLPSLLTRPYRYTDFE